MTKTRNGKIARLPRHIRDELNRRMADGETGKALVEWLNGHSTVQKVLAREFGGRPMNEQNLTEWRQGGFEEWRKQEENRDWVRTLAEDAEELEEECGEQALADRVSTWVALAMGRMLREASEAGAWKDPELRGTVLAISRELTQLRRANHEGEHLRLRMEEAQVAEEQRREEGLEKMEQTMEEEQWRPIKTLLGAMGRESVLQTLTQNMTPENARKIRDLLKEQSQGSRIADDSCSNQAESN